MFDIEKVVNKIEEVLGWAVHTNEVEHSGLECVIIYKGKRATIKSKRVWKSIGTAKRAISCHVKNRMAQYKDYIWRTTVKKSDDQVMPPELEKFIQDYHDQILSELIIVPLRDYMYNEYVAKEKNDQRTIL